MINIFGILAIIFISSILLTGAILRYAITKNILDVPNKRSLHAASMPRGGGAAFVLLYSLVLLYLWVNKNLDYDLFAPLIIGGLLIAAIGFWDDHKPLPARIRFLVHIIAAAFVVYMIGGVDELNLNSKIVYLGWFGDLLAIVFIVWIINLYNFMDGIDGIASVEAIFVLIGAATLVAIVHANGIKYQLLSNEAHLIIFLLLSFAITICGFLVWNWPPAKIFMGDVGSGYIGYILSVFILYTHNSEMVNVWVWFILLAVFLVDSSITLVTRIVTGQQWYQAHRTHAYQQLAQKWGSHKKVTLSILVINIIWLLPLAWFAMIKPDLGAIFIAIAYLPLISIAILLRAGRN